MIIVYVKKVLTSHERHSNCYFAVDMCDNTFRSEITKYKVIYVSVWCSSWRRCSIFTLSSLLQKLGQKVMTYIGCPMTYTCTGCSEDLPYKYNSIFLLLLYYIILYGLDFSILPKYNEHQRSVKK